MKRRSFITVAAGAALSRSTSAAPLGLNTWKDLLSYRSPEALQKQLKNLGGGWKVQRVENAAGELNLDYYSAKVTTMPKQGGVTMSEAAVFSAFKQHLMSSSRGSAQRVAFEPRTASDSTEKAGSLMYLRFKPFSFVSCQTLSYCADLDWLKDSGLCEKMDVVTKKAQMESSVDDAYIVVDFSSPQELRVSTVQEIQSHSVTVAGFAFSGAGTHPVSGNRAFGYSKTPSGMVIYTIGADRVRPAVQMFDTKIGQIGYCLAEVFWRELLTEFVTVLAGLGGSAVIRPPDRQRIGWQTAVDQQIWAPTGKWVD